MTATAPPPRRFPLRFSLRLLLLAVTAFAIGFPIWYRWPYEEEEDASVLLSNLDPFAPPGGPTKVNRLRVTTWQRQWGGGRIKHGPELLFENDKLLNQRTYRAGELTGPYRAGSLSGHYVAGQKEGRWTWHDEQGKELGAAQWRNGLLDGEFHFLAQEGNGQARRRDLVFSRGQLMSMDGKPVDDRLGKLLAAGGNDDSALVQSLVKETNVEFQETPLRDMANYLIAVHEVPIVVDPLHADPQQPITGSWGGLHFSAILAALAAEHDLTCDQRYGLIWITSAHDGKRWRDPTGISDVVPPAGSGLVSCWTKPADIESPIELPLADVLHQLADNHSFDCDTSAFTALPSDSPGHEVSLVLKQHPLHEILGILLYQTRCRCKLEGETLVILPPEEMP